MKISTKDLDQIVNVLNVRTGSPLKTWNEDGKSNVGNYCLDGAYGGYSLERIVNEAGGVEDIFRCGHVTKRELYYRISAFLDGIQSAEHSTWAHKGKGKRYET